MKRLLFIGFLLLVPFFGTGQPAEKACFSVPGGFYEQSFSLEIFPFYQQHHIRFTTNGNRPTAQSQLYTEPLLLDASLYSTSNIYTIQITPDDKMFYPDSVPHCIVIRAAVFNEADSCISEVATNSYFIVPGVNYDPSNPKWTGNYYQEGLAWERLANIECFSHPFFETIPQNSFKHLVLKPFSASWNKSGVNYHIEVSNQVQRFGVPDSYSAWETNYMNTIDGFLLGRIVHTQPYMVVPGTNEIIINLDVLPGVYLLNTGDQTIRVVKTS